MAGRGKTTRRRNASAVRSARGIYVDGSAARKLQEIPSRPSRQAPARRQTVQRTPHPRQLSRQAQRNRMKAMRTNFGFVAFLIVVSVALLFFCVHFLQLKSEITSCMKNVAQLESELTQLKEDNDAYYSQVVSIIDLNKIKKIAVGKLGMHAPSEEQKMTYKTARSSYIRQYQDIPDSK